MSEGEFSAIHIKITRRLLARVDACASEEGLSRAEWCRVALAAAAERSENQAEKRARLAALRPGRTGMRE